MMHKSLSAFRHDKANRFEWHSEMMRACMRGLGRSSLPTMIYSIESDEEKGTVEIELDSNRARAHSDGEHGQRRNERLDGTASIE